MITFEEACKVAMRYFSSSFGDIGLDRIYDVGDSWIFSGADRKRMVRYGRMPVRIYKSSGEMVNFIPWDEENSSVVDRRKIIPVPSKYVPVYD